MLNLFFFMVFSGFYVFCFFYNHILLVMLSLEYLLISLFLFFILFIMKMGLDFFLIIFFLTFSVCEGVLGLSILVSLIRSHGNDYLMNLNLLW